MISMKKILITLTVLFAVIDIMAQEHLSFKGIPIEGSMTEFCQKLKSKGFTSIGRENNITLFSGDFTGRQATVGVTATDDGKNVFAVVVLFDPSGEWNTLLILTTIIRIYILVNMASRQFQRKQPCPFRFQYRFNGGSASGNGCIW